MSLKGVLSCVVLAGVLATPALAQVGGHPIELSGSAGLLHYDARARIHDGPAFGLTAGWRSQPWLTIEGTTLFGPSKADTAPGYYAYSAGGAMVKDGAKHNFFYAGADLRWNLRPAQNRIVPFLLTGGGYGQSHGGAMEGTEPQKVARGSASLGAGLLYSIRNQRTYLRFEVRDVLFRNIGIESFSNHVAARVGLQYVFRGKILDQDRDHVRDWLDTCPDTPIGCTVDANGCPHDADGDGVCDGVDKCPNTPKGCKVNGEGCTSDADGDGVCDDLDTCPDTPKGCTVDAHGCPADPDGDGVCDGVDKCPNTPKGCTVDASGCPGDADGDGVCDGVDVCPNTPAGLRVDEHGCPIEVREKEVQLLNTGTLRIQNIEFDTGKATLKPEADPVLRQVGSLLVSYPALKIEIGGHTDDRGTLKKNMTLSQARADTVRAWLQRNYNFPADQFTTHGYGPTRPIAPNTSTLGRSKNRRVEFKVLNTEQLKIEREKRRFLLRNESAPRDTSGAAPQSAPEAPGGGASPPLPSPAPAPAPPDTTVKPQSVAPRDTTVKPQPAVPDTTRKP